MSSALREKFETRSSTDVDRGSFGAFGPDTLIDGVPIQTEPLNYVGNLFSNQSIMLLFVSKKRYNNARLRRRVILQPDSLLRNAVVLLNNRLLVAT